MKYSWTLGRPFGIVVAVHWTFLLLILWIVAVNLRQGSSLPQILVSVLFILVLFLCVTLHELGHSLAARRYGIGTRSITLLPIGGMASIEEMPENPKHEIIITLSGIVVNVIIAMVLWAVIGLLPGQDSVDLQAVTGSNFLMMLMYVNLLIVAFNLIPAFPMDGGRILRALLSFRFDRLKATRYSMLAGQAFGVLFALVGIFINPLLFIIGIFVVIGARTEYVQVKYATLLVDHQAKDILMRDYTSFRPEEPLKNAVDRLLSSAQSDFLVQENGGVIGILSREDIIRGLSSYGEDVQVRDVMSTGFRRIEASASLKDIFKTMQDDQAGLIPVFEDQELVGVINQENIREFIMVQSALRDL